MNYRSQAQTSFPDRVSRYALSHWVSLGLFLSAYGMLYLSSVILNRQAIVYWDKAVAIYSPSSISPLLPRSLLDPLFYVTSFPALIIGSAMLCYYSIRGIGFDGDRVKLYIAILLTAFGFIYQVIGAWPLQHQIDFPWQWQKQIVSFGSYFTWSLYILSLIVLSVGVISLYKHSVIYHLNQRTEEDSW